jgi:hypothetical protein
MTFLYKAFVAAGLSVALAGCGDAPVPAPSSAPVHEANNPLGFYASKASPAQKELMGRFFKISDRFEALRTSMYETISQLENEPDYLGQNGKKGAFRLEARLKLADQESDADLLLSQVSKKFGQASSFPAACVRLQNVRSHTVADHKMIQDTTYTELSRDIEKLAFRTQFYIGDVEHIRMVSEFSAFDESKQKVDEAEKRADAFAAALMKYKEDIKPTIHKLDEMSGKIRQKQLQIGLAITECKASFSK